MTELHAISLVLVNMLKMIMNVLLMPTVSHQYTERKNADDTDYVDDYGRHIYEQESVTPTTEACPTGDKTLSELSADVNVN